MCLDAVKQIPDFEQADHVDGSALFLPLFLRPSPFQKRHKLTTKMIFAWNKETNRSLKQNSMNHSVAFTFFSPFECSYILAPWIFLYLNKTKEKKQHFPVSRSFSNSNYFFISIIFLTDNFFLVFHPNRRLSVTNSLISKWVRKLMGFRRETSSSCFVFRDNERQRETKSHQPTVQIWLPRRAKWRLM